MVAGASRGSAMRSLRRWRGKARRSRSRRATSRRSRAAAERIGGDVLAVPVEVRSADAIRRWAAETEKRFGGVDLLFTNSGGPPAGAAMSFDDARVAGCRGAAAVQHVADGAGGGAVDAGARRRRDPDVDLVVGQGADPESRALDGAAGIGVGAGEDARDRARAVEDPRQPDHPGPRWTPIACASWIRSPQRSRGSRRTRPSRSRWRRSRWAGTA